MNAIEFRVQGGDSKAVADELAIKMKSLFHVEANIKSPPPAKAVDGVHRADPGTAAVLLLVDILLAGFHAYKQFVLEPAAKERERLIRNWTDVVIWAHKKLPTTVRAVIGEHDLLLHDADPESLHDLTAKAAKDVSIVPE